MRRLTKREAERFWAKVDKTPGHGPNGDCWLWTASQRGVGYGGFGLDGSLIVAHRVAFRLSGGSLKPGQIVMHSCDVRLCCNPAHLRVGTQADNIRDAYAKGRIRPPTRAVPMTDEELRQLKYEYDHGLSKRTLSKKWDLDRTTLTRLLKRAEAVAEIRRDCGASASASDDVSTIRD
ncbi:MAG TPA: HNH endonuclease signature motif containing protein [Planctomycetaceae bacterium]|nr:HNH endonuclease signature motif containing protein [Planctomycetaceae bacterium]